MAINCLATPNAVFGNAGVTLIEVKVAFVTTNPLLPDTEPNVAVMVVLPAATGVAKPVAVAIVATLVLLELHVTDVVILAVVLLEYVPVAINDSGTPSAVLAVAGVTAIDTKLAAVIVNVVLPDTP